MKKSIYKRAATAPSQPEEPLQVLTREQLAKRWQVSPETIDRQRRKDPDFPQPFRIGTSLRWRIDSIERFEQKEGSDGNRSDQKNSVKESKE